MKRFPILVITIFFLSACSKGTENPSLGTPSALPNPGVTTIPAPNPGAAAGSFLEGWESWDYKSMYALLSPLTRDGLSQEAFSARYEEIKRIAALTEVDYQIVSSLVISPQAAEVRFRVTLKSAVVGDINAEIRMDLTKERDEEVWRVAWTDAIILPELSGGNKLRLDQVTPIRANIYDRNKLAFATQADAVALAIVPNRIGDQDAEETMLSTLRRLFDVATNEEIRFEYESFLGTDFYTPLGEVALVDFQPVEGVLRDVGGVQWTLYSTRYYPGGGLTPFGGGYAPHSVGYVSWIGEEFLEDYLAEGYQQDEYVGQVGLEFAFESDLRGVSGGSLHLIDPNGLELGIIASRNPEPPYAVYTTIDRDLQRYVQQAIEDFVGAVVVVERDSGAILAMASSPGFDPNLFDTNNPNFNHALQELVNNPNQALLNRSTLGLYPLGSVFKIVTMAAALESGFYQPDTIYNCGLEFRELPGFPLYDWRYEKELPAPGSITLMQGLELSCNPYFWHIGLDLYNRGLTTALPEMAKGFGLGELTGVEIDEDPGLVPDPESKLDRFGEEWALRDAVQLAIGQSFLLVTPIQVARFIAAVGNGGTIYLPQIVLRIENAEGDVRQEFRPEVQGELPVNSENLEAIQQAMVNVVRDSRATAYRKFLGLNINVAGKTGTATSGDFTDPHAWFAGYTFEEREDFPDIVVVVVLELQGEGSEWAAPVFRRVVEAYFKGRPQSLYPWEARIRVRKTATPTPGPEDVEVEGTPSP